MSKRIGYLSDSLGAVTAETAALALRRCSGNTGNLAFQWSLARLVEEPVELVSWQDDPAEVADRFELLMIPEANALNPVRDYSARADFLHAAGLPVVVAGLGAQGQTLGEVLSLAEGTVRYARALSEHAKVVGVRGDYSAEVASRAGVGNAVVVGCPSSLINLDPDLPSAIATRLDAGGDDLVVTGGDMKRVLRPVERRLFGWLRRPQSYVAQSGATALVAAGEGSLKQRLAVRRHVAGNQLSPSFESRYRRLATSFFDVAAWVEHLRTFDLACGTRVHGSVLALQAGIPSLCITHDARTLELCTTLGVPHVPAATVVTAGSARDLHGLVPFDAAAFGRRRQELAQGFLGLLSDGGLTPTAALRALAGER